MEEILTLATRPSRLSAMVGQGLVAKSIRTLVAKRIPRAWMFSGPSGTGKTSLARIVAVSLQCTHQETWGTPCAKCWSTGWTIHEVNASETAGVDDAASLVNIARHAPQPPSRYRVMILDEAQRLTSAAQNLLLKPVEDPPKTTVWIICTTEPTKILRTLRRRCVEYTMRPLVPEKQEVLLQRAAKAGKITRPLDPLLEQCDLHGVSSPAALIMALERYGSGLSAAESVVGGEASQDTLRICKAVTNGDVRGLQTDLKALSADQARLVRASVAGWLRGTLLRDPSPRNLFAVEQLTEMAPLEDGLLYSWLSAKLIKVARKYKER